MTWTPEQMAEASELSRDFLRAVARGDGDAIWSLFSERARAFVVNRALERGMDFDLASRLRSGTATQEEVDEYRGFLAAGLQRDLGDVDVEAVELEAEPEPDTTDGVRVRYLTRLDFAVGGASQTIPAGSVLLLREGDAWRVDRLVPRPG